MQTVLEFHLDQTKKDYVKHTLTVPQNHFEGERSDNKTFNSLLKI